MIEVKNISQETLEVIEMVDTSVPGCRIKLSAFQDIKIAPGEAIAFLGYEPGVSRLIRPIVDPDIPRNGLDPHMKALNDNG